MLLDHLEDVFRVDRCQLALQVDDAADEGLELLAVEGVHSLREDGLHRLSKPLEALARLAQEDEEILRGEQR